jgi:excisionase family DNA binding protein
MAAPSALVSKQPDHSLEVPITQKIALTLPECSALSGFKVCALRAAIWAGELAFVRVGSGGRYLIRREALEKFMRSQEQKL